jgi:hypothetical protein
MLSIHPHVLTPGITLHLIQGGTVSLDALPTRAVALDGYVQGPFMGDELDRWSFDHHGRCDRLITAATCEQVWTASQLGFDWQSRDIFVNDLDGDTVLSLYIIRALHGMGYAIGSRHAQDKLARLVRCVGLVDAHGPAAYRLMSGLDKHLVQAYYAGPMEDIYQRSPSIQERFEEWPALIDAAFEATAAFMRLDFDRVYPPKKTFNVDILFDNDVACLASSDGWAFEMLYDEYDVVVLMDAAAKNSTRYTIGKVSDLVPFNLQALLAGLNAMEPGWGGGSSIGGSPRLDDGVSSRLAPEQVWAAVCEELES